MLYTGRLIQVRETVSRKWKDNSQATPTPWPPEKVPPIYHFQANEWSGGTLGMRFANYFSAFDHEGDHSTDHFLLIDDAPQTYWDEALWTWLKDYCQAGLLSFRFWGYEYDTAGKFATPPHISPE